MSHLVLELRPGEMMVVNGATIRFRNKCRVELVSQARFLFGKQIMAPHEAETSIRKLYYRLQTSYVGPIEERAEAVEDVQRLFDHLRQDALPEVADALLVVEEAVRSEDFYKALKLLRAMIRDENRDCFVEHDAS
jgi:flagellar protein FlbT